MKIYFKPMIGLTAVALFMAGCGAVGKEAEKTAFAISVADASLIYEESFSPNEAYVEKESDRVYQTIEVYRKPDDTIVVNADSNSAFFEGLQYDIPMEEEIAPEDISVEWLTAMGSEEDTQENQRCVARVVISQNGEIISERKIHFLAKGMEMVADAVSHSKK